MQLLAVSVAALWTFAFPEDTIPNPFAAAAPVAFQIGAP